MSSFLTISTSGGRTIFSDAILQAATLARTQLPRVPRAHFLASNKGCRRDVSMEMHSGRTNTIGKNSITTVSGISIGASKILTIAARRDVELKFISFPRTDTWAAVAQFFASI